MGNTREPVEPQEFLILSPPFWPDVPYEIAWASQYPKRSRDSFFSEKYFQAWKWGGVWDISSTPMYPPRPTLKQLAVSLALLHQESSLWFPLLGSVLLKCAVDHYFPEGGKCHSFLCSNLRCFVSLWAVSQAGLTRFTTGKWLNWVDYNLKSILESFWFIFNLIFVGTTSVNTFPSVWEEANRWAKRRKEENKAGQQSSTCFLVSLPSFWYVECCHLNWKFPGRQMTDTDWCWCQNKFSFF